MTMAKSDPSTNPPYYPSEGSYADLLCWHMDYWGTRPDGNTTANGERWTDAEFKEAIFGKNPNIENHRVLLRNWRGGGPAPSSTNASLIARALFGGNPLFDRWRKELEKARNRSANGKNKKTEVFSDPPPVQKATAHIPRLSEHFMGRNNDVEALAKVLVSSEGPCALLVLGGPGIGKTELTKAIAHHENVAKIYGARRYFVSLETATTAAAMQDAIIRAVGCDPATGFATALKSIAGQHALLILDNLETPWTPVAQRSATENALAELAASATFIASFRGRDKIRSVNWCHELWLAELSDEAAATLFGTIAGPGIEHDPMFKNFIEALGGIPLAIELVALRAHVRTSLTPLWNEWLRIGGELATHADFAESRLTSLPLSIELSLRPFITPERSEPALRLFSLLGALPSGLANQDANALLTDSAFGAAEKLCRSGIAIERSDRIDLLPPIREHAQRRYPPRGDDTESWVDHFLELVSSLRQIVGSAAGKGALSRLQPEFRNIEAALRAKIDRNQRADASEAFYSFSRVVRWMPMPTTILEEVAALCQKDNDAMGAANFIKAIGNIALDRSDYDAAEEAFERAGALYRLAENRPERETDCIRMLGNIALYRADYKGAYAKFKIAIDFYRQSGDILGEANCLKSLANIALHRSEEAEAERHFKKAKTLYAQVSDDLGEAHCIKGIAEIILRRLELADALVQFEVALALYRRIGDSLGEANCLKRMGDIALHQQRYEQAYAAYGDARDIYAKLDSKLGEADCLRAFGEMAMQQGNVPEARRCFTEALALYKMLGSQLGIAECLKGLAGIALHLAHHADSRDLYTQALEVFDSIDSHSGKNECLSKLAELDDRRMR